MIIGVFDYSFSFEINKILPTNKNRSITFVETDDASTLKLFISVV